MSGGSYDYLCAQDAEMILGGGHDEDLQRMSDRLAGLGYPDAAQETLSVLLEARQARVRLETRIRRLAGIWKEVEWEDSGDGGYINRAIAEYRGETP